MMKNNLFKIVSVLFLFTILLGCDSDSIEDLYDEYSDHKIFLVEATVAPLNNDVELGDTIYISINVDSLRLVNQLTGNTIQLDTAWFRTQIQLYDRLDDMVVNAQYILQNGNLYEDDSSVELNSQGFSFGAQNDYQLHVGIIFNEKGKYAIGFNNYPNPNASGSLGYRYDVYHGVSTSGNGFKSQDFVDYYFNLESGYYTKPDLDNYQYILDNCIYDESVFFVNIN